MATLRIWKLAKTSLRSHVVNVTIKEQLNQNKSKFEGEEDSLRVQFEEFRQASMCALRSAKFHMK
jgi:hypothetical protein